MAIVDYVHSEGIQGMALDSDAGKSIVKVYENLKELDIENVKIDASLARGFDYYTGTIFEIFDTSSKNNRSLLGGGRYDNLTGMFSENPITGVGFGMGDVTMRDFLETHNLLKDSALPTSPTLMIIPIDGEKNMQAQKIAQRFRENNINVGVDLSDKKLGKKISSANKMASKYILTIGDDELKSGNYTMKELSTKIEASGTLEELIKNIT